MPRDTSLTCDECGKSFGRRSDLVRHKSIHVLNKEDMKYHCSFDGCNFSATQWSNIKSHENTHTDSKPHQCPTCQFRCNYGSSLSRHRVRKHGYIPEHRTRDQATTETSKASQTSSNSSSLKLEEGPASSESLIDTPSERQTPLAGPEVLNPSPLPIPPSVRLTRSHTRESFVTFNTHLTTANYEANAVQSLSNAVAGSSLDVSPQQVPLMAPNEVTDPTRDNLLAQWYDSQANVAPVLPPVEYPPHATSILAFNHHGCTPLSNTPTQPYMYRYNALALDNTQMPSVLYANPVAAPSHGGYSLTFGGVSYGSNGRAANETFSEQYLQGFSFASPDMGIYPQGYDGADQYPTAGPSGFPTQGFYHNYYH